MSTVLSPDLQRAQQIAATAQVLAIVTLVVMGITIGTRLAGPIVSLLFGDAPWRDSVNRLGLVLIALLPTALFFEAVNQLRGALKLYGKGDFFSAATASRVANAGDNAMGAMIALIAIVPNLTLWVSHQGGFDMNIEPEYFGMLAFALFVSAVGRILAAATQLKAENDSFV